MKSKDNKRFKELTELIQGDILSLELMSKHTSYKIGGAADFYAYPKDFEDLSKLIEYTQKENIPRFVIGNGSNILVSDNGIRGLVIDLSKGFRQIKIQGSHLTVGAGMTLEEMLNFCADRGLSGNERLAGIPGHIGGCIKLNAGAFGGNISDRIVSVSMIDKYGTLIKKTKNEIEWGYRYTSFEKDHIIVEAEFHLSDGNPKEMQAVQNGYIKRRKQKQPLSLPSAGSVFKRPQGDYAGRLIEDSGCKGLRIGDAMVSRKHANFIVNCGVATARDVLRVIDEVKEKVFQQFGVVLEMEVHLVGFSEEPLK